MGFLLDLLRRWFGVPRTLEAPTEPVADAAEAGSRVRPPIEVEPPAAVVAEPAALPRPATIPATSLPWLAAPPEPPAETESPELPPTEAAASIEAGPHGEIVIEPIPSIQPPAFAPTEPTTIDEPAIAAEPPGDPEPAVEGRDVADPPAIDTSPEADLVPEASVEADFSPPEPEASSPPNLPADDEAEPPAFFRPEEPAEPDPPIEAEAVGLPDLPATETPVVAAPPLDDGPEPLGVAESPVPESDEDEDEAGSFDESADRRSPEGVEATEEPVEAPISALVDAPTEAADEAPDAIEVEPPAPVASAAEEGASIESEELIEVAEEEAPAVQGNIDPLAEPEVGEAAPVEEDREIAGSAAIEVPAWFHLFAAVEPPAQVEVAAPPPDDPVEDEVPPEVAAAVEDEAESSVAVAVDLPGASPTEADQFDVAAEAEAENESPIEAIDAEFEAERATAVPADLDLFAGGSSRTEATPDEADPPSSPELEAPAEPELPAEGPAPDDLAGDSPEAVASPTEVGPGTIPPPDVEVTEGEPASPVVAEDLAEIDLFAVVAPESVAAAEPPVEVDLLADPSEVEVEPPVEAIGAEPASPAESAVPAWPFEPEPRYEAGFLPPFEVAHAIAPDVEATPAADTEPATAHEASVPIEPEGSVDPAVEPGPRAMPSVEAEPAVEVEVPDEPAVEADGEIEPPPAAPLGLAGDLEAPLWSEEPPDAAPPAEDPAARAVGRAERRAAAAGARETRRAAAAERRATDILYLGRGVSEALHDREGDHAQLDRLALPHLDSPAELAERLGIAVPRLRWLAFHAEVASRVHYVGFEVAKRGGGTRRLSAPHRSLAEAQRWIFEEIVARLPVEGQAHGFVAGRSILTNARPHSGRALVVNLDLEGFFPTIGFRRVRAVFERAGYSPALATILGLLCTESPRRVVTHDGATLHVATGPRSLPQGACTSPGLSNQVAGRLDRRLAGLAGALGATYTRYADDLTFSGAATLDPKVGYLLAQARRIAASEGFRVNEAKTRVQRPNTAQTVTGLVVNDRPGVARAEVRRLRAILHRARLEGLDAQNRAGHPDFHAYLEGMIAFVSMARPEVGALLREGYRGLRYE